MFVVGLDRSTSNRALIESAARRGGSSAELGKAPGIGLLAPLLSPTTVVLPLLPAVGAGEPRRWPWPENAFACLARADGT